MSECRACGKEIIFLKTTKGKLIPINKETVGMDDQFYDNERHVSHFSDCPEAKKFRRPK